MKNILIISSIVFILWSCNQPALQNKIKTNQDRDQPITPEPGNDYESKPTREKNTALVGVWKYTEVLSSGSGDNYMSFSTEFFMGNCTQLDRQECRCWYFQGK